MYDRIFVPLDGFPLAEQVLPYVTRIAAGMGIPIHLAQVVPLYPRPWLTRPTAFTKAGIRRGPRRSHGLPKQRQANISGVEVTCDAHEGDKSPESLVAMSNHGRSGITRLLMGSVTDKVLHHIKNPMLIFREHRDGDPDTKLETIIVLLDGSPLTESVLPHVTALAKALDLKVALVRAASTAEHFIAATGFHQIDGASGLQFHNFKTMSQAAGNQASEYITEQEICYGDRGSPQSTTR